MATVHNKNCRHSDCDHTKKRYLKILSKIKCETPTIALRKTNGKCFVLALSVCVILMPAITNGQAVTRDPRFYSREGDYNYKWPNPGDPEYR